MALQVCSIGAHTLRVAPDPKPAEGTPLFDDGMFGCEPFDETGLHRVWPASLALCQYLVNNMDDGMQGRRVMELGPGLGLPSLLCAKQNAHAVVAVDMNAAVCGKLNAAFANSTCLSSFPERAWAHCLSWDDTEAVVNLAIEHEIDLILLADTMYPAKDNSQLLACLRCLRLRLPSLTIIAALTCRDTGLHKYAIESLKALPGSSSVKICTHVSELDPLYGASSIDIVRLLPVSEKARTESG